MNLAKDDLMRFILLTTTMSVVFGLLLFFGTAPFLHSPTIKPEESKGIVELVLPLFTGQMGSMVGFYFGSKDK